MTAPPPTREDESPDVPAREGPDGAGSWHWLPQHAEALTTMEERAAALATSRDDDGRDARASFVLAGIGEGQQLGIAYADTVELVTVSNVANVPGTPAAIAGVVNWRGRLLTVIDPCPLFRAVPPAADQDVDIVVVQSGAVLAGIRVASVLGEGRYDPRELAPAADSGADGVVAGIYGGRVALLDVARLLSHPAVVVDDLRG